MTDALRELPPVGARLVALELLDRVALSRARIGGVDPEALHDFRVALRRLRSWIRGFRPELDGTLKKGLRRRLSELADATGEARDLEVLLEALDAMGPRAGRAGPAVESLRRTLARREASAVRRAERAAEGFDAIADDLRDALSHWRADVRAPQEPTRLAGRLADVVREHAAALDAALRSATSPARQAEAHVARIEAKRVRYLLEPAAARVPQAARAVRRLKAMQERLGQMHDDDVLRARASGMRASPARAALQERLSRRLSVHHARLIRGGLARLASSLRSDVEAAASALDRLAGEGLEHERKFLLRGLPPRARRAPASVLEQGWLPGAVIVERLRRERGPRSTSHWRTIKAGRGVSRIEAEERIPAALFRELWPLTEGRRVRKERRRIEEGGLTWEIDSFLDRELVLAEVELPSGRTPVELPAWLRPHVVREVTDEAEYVNRNLAR